ncbi:MAG: stage II sporulation protein M [Bacillota bacterium]
MPGPNMYEPRTGTGKIKSGWPVYFIVVLVFACGLAAGSLSAVRMDGEKYSQLSAYVRDFVANAGGASFDSGKMARNALINNSLMITAIYVLGLTIIGMPVILGIVFVRGFVIGFTVCFLTSDMAAGGLFLTLSAVLPHNLLYIPALCLGSASALIFATLLLKRNFNSHIAVWPGFVRYTGIMALVFIVAAGSGIVEGYITPKLTQIVTGVLNSNP